jgi:hypothetical protein
MMMWNLPAPSGAESKKNLITGLRRASGKWDYPLATNETAQILDLYKKYIKRRGRPCKSLRNNKVPTGLGDAISHAYSQVQQGGRLHALRETLRLQANLCPYCGFGEVRDLDHHLPRSTYKALAIFAMNLIPCCHSCNGKKRALASSKAVGHFNHVYLEHLPNEPFFRAKVNVSRRGLRVSFHIRKTPGISQLTVARLRKQFQRLDLHDRLTKQVNIFLLDLRPAIEMFADLGSTKLSAYLTSCRDQYRNDFGNNDWRVALMAGLAGSSKFCTGGYKYCFG